MKKNIPILLIMALLLPLLGQAQSGWDLKENSTWIFPQYLGVHFEDGIATPVSSSMTLNFLPINSDLGVYLYASSTAVSDAKGQLLFYTNGSKVWDRNGDTMLNGIIGSGVMVNGFPAPDMETSMGGNMLQSILIAPVLGKPHQYYIFALNGEVYFGFPVQPTAHELRYSIVDMSGNNGLGAVVVKNIRLDESLDGMITATKGDNCNVWIIVHDRDNPRFKSFEITPEGINPTPVISEVGSFKGFAAYDIGRMVISPDRKTLAVASEDDSSFLAVTTNPAGVELFDFDAFSGKISNARMLTDYLMLQQLIEQHNDYGFGRTSTVCFSPDNSKFYLNLYNKIYQYNLALPNIAAIRNSMTYIDSMPLPGFECHMQLAPDGSIYLADYTTLNHQLIDTAYVNTDTPFLCTIRKPNLLGQSCNFVRKSLSFPMFSTAYAGGSVGDMGQHVYDKPDALPTVYNSAVICSIQDSLVLKSTFTKAWTYEWDDGSANGLRTVYGPGTYWLRSNNFCHYQVDTFKIGISQEPVIRVDGFELSTVSVYSYYQWLLNGKPIAGATNRICQVVQNGDYQVVVTDEKGCVDTAERYQVTNASIGASKIGADQLIIYPNPFKEGIYINASTPFEVSLVGIDGRVWYRAANTNYLAVPHLAKGMYFLNVNDSKGTIIRVEKVVKVD